MTPAAILDPVTQLLAASVITVYATITLAAIAGILVVDWLLDGDLRARIMGWWP